MNIHWMIIMILISPLSSCGKPIKIKVEPVSVDHKVTIDIEAFQAVCQYATSPETCIDDLILAVKTND